ncbi:MAG: hypothetical protein A2156_11150 [Deltaproteobacteria bacterium RBG_16_48_10]|nr:MAG: hypothetical protein A2156_11150 [Deltaproteobacteria bacterium RBG_16_48_10]
MIKKGIDHSTFSRDELSDDHGEKEFVELLDGLPKRFLIFLLPSELFQCQLQIVHQPPFIPKEFLLLRIQYSRRLLSFTAL